MRSDKQEKTWNHENVPNKKDEVATDHPGKRTRRATAAVKSDVASDDKQEGGADMSDSSAESAGSADETSSSDSSERANCSGSDSGSGYKPRRSANRKIRNNWSEIDIDVEVSLADSVKKRRRTPTWKFGANGRSTIVSCPDNNSVGPKSQGKSSKLVAKGSNNSDQELDNIDSAENLRLIISDDYALPENTVDSWKAAITELEKQEDEKAEGEKEETEKIEGGNTEVEKDESMKLDMEKEEGGKLDVDKDEGMMVKIMEEYEDQMCLCFLQFLQNNLP
ncbi:hypothetical protein L1987_20945 [Smallanthus sonchifolius]|uniref:Uncharacterized protein n=1 Tax=Smallanthus sonchifolius TaxID=185202 RepID=A0ACB9IUQ5_9ASTR|nr:hypothetical protein L1987_20945 [Smallanthus sonchifolius]